LPLACRASASPLAQRPCRIPDPRPGPSCSVRMPSVPQARRGCAMKFSLTSSLWAGGTLILVLLFSVWSVWLHLAVGRQQQEVSSRATLISRLSDLEQSLREVERSIATHGIDAAAAQSAWRQLLTDYQVHVQA